MKLLIKKLDDFEDKYQVYGRIVGIKRLLDDLRVTVAKLAIVLQKAKQIQDFGPTSGIKALMLLYPFVKSRRVVLTDSEDEAAENSSKQGRNLQKDESEVFKTPKQGKSSGEIDISPQGLEVAETLAEALSQIKTKRRNVKSRVRRRLNID
ncbi:hypothetical protein Tco_1512050 [Tanacetum coccineum]